MVSPQDSGALSGGFVQWVKALFDPNNRIDAELLHYIIRKTAHFSEYFLLSLLYLLLQTHMPKQLRKSCTLLAPFAGLLTAVFDEFIQSFTGRGSLVSDVLIDFSGVLTAIGFFFLINHVRNNLKRRCHRASR